MKIKIIFSFAATLILILCISGSSPESTDLICLRFSSNYPGEKRVDQKTGLLWALSYLGAELPANCLRQALTQHNDSAVFELNISKVGFNKPALEALRKIMISLKESEEYTVKNSIELGEFITYTLGSSWHYYEITGAFRTLDDFKKRYSFHEAASFPVLKSDVAFHHRLIEMVPAKKVGGMAFIAQEGEGDLQENTFVADAYEVADIMPNGQLRFAVYDKNGELTDASARKYGKAGKPVKCLWCHEINLQPLFNANPELSGRMSPAEFNSQINAYMDLLKEYRAQLKGEIDFTKRQDHALMEILYISFMQPSAYKLINEWGSLNTEAELKYSSGTTHDHEEYDFLTRLLHRASVKEFSPYKTVQLPDSIWEPNSNEPDLFKKR